MSSALAINIWSNNYTIQAAFFAMTGSIVLMKNSKEKNRWLYIIGLFFICIGFMWRIQGALLSVPFVLLDIVVRFIKQKKEIEELYLVHSYTSLLYFDSCRSTESC